MGNIHLVQTVGLGDVFFIQKMCNVLSENNTVYLPVEDSTWSRGANRLRSPAIIAPKSNLVAEVADAERIDLSYQPQPRGYVDTMTSKYDGVGIDWRDWSDYFLYDRDIEAEKRIADHYNVEPGDRFIICNEYFSSEVQVNSQVKKALPKEYDGKIVDLDPYIPETTVFDYCWLFENAEEIHTTDTCFLFIIETLNLNTDRLVVHCRRNLTKETISPLFTKVWEWH